MIRVPGDLAEGARGAGRRRFRTKLRPCVRGRSAAAVGWTLLLGMGLALGSPGALDPSFNGSGLLSLKVGGDGGGALAIAQQADGKLVLAGSGTLNPDGGSDFAFVRVSGDGTPDSTFSTDGVCECRFRGSD